MGWGEGLEVCPHWSAGVTLSPSQEWPFSCTSEWNCSLYKNPLFPALLSMTGLESGAATQQALSSSAPSKLGPNRVSGVLWLAEDKASFYSCKILQLGTGHV